MQQVPIRRGDDPDVDVHVAGPANPQNPLVLEHAQDFYLNVEGHLADFIQKNGSAVRQLEFSRSPALPRPGKRAVFIAEQFAFHQIPGQRAAVDRHERSFGTGAGLVNRLRNHFLAGAALALDQDRRHTVGGNLC